MQRILPCVLSAGLLMSLCGASRAEQNLRGAKTPLKIIPFPRHVQQKADRSWTGGAIILPANPSEKMKIAAEEINLRLKDLGAETLDVLPGHEGVRGTAIVLSIGGRGVPAEQQGYMIDSRGRKRVRLAGHDEQGLLWAAVTFRRMLCRNAQGRLVLISALIRDWPDIAYRSMGHVNSFRRQETERTVLNAFAKNDKKLEERIKTYMEETRRTYDVHFRLKYNYVYWPSWGLPTHYDIVVARMRGDVEKAERYLAVVKQANDYAASRGIRLGNYQSSSIGTDADKGDREISRCAYHRSHHRYFCWTLDEHNRRKAEQVAKYMNKVGVTFVTVHAYDGGGIEDPAGWSKRCKWCKERFGDDRVAADVHVAAIWHDAFKKFAPNCIHSITQYPYTVGVLTEPDNEYYERTHGFYKALTKALPDDPDLALCIRENYQRNVGKFYDIVGPRMVFFWWMIDGVHGDRWIPFGSSRYGNVKAFYRKGRHDMMHSRGNSPHSITFPAGAQYQWNTSTPGAVAWPGPLDPIRDGMEPKEFFQVWLPKFTEEWFGEKAGKDLADIFRNCISPSYLITPSFVATECRFANTSRLMAQQYKAVVKATEGIDRVWKRIEAGEKDLIKSGRERYFYGLSEQAARVRAFGSYNLARMTVAEGLNQGKPKRELARKLASAIRRTKADNDFARRMDARTNRKPKLGLARWTGKKRRPARDLYNKHDYDANIRDLENLLAMLNGTVAELREPKKNEATVRWLFRDGEGAKFSKKGGTRQSLVSYPTQNASAKAIQLDGLVRPWKDGLRMSFPAVDVSGYREKGGRLRFYVNGGGGGHDFTFWVRSYSATEVQGPEPSGQWWQTIAGYVTVDNIEATWQLVDVPLEKVMKPRHTHINGLSMNYAQSNRVSGPFWVDSMYVCMPSKPVEAKVPVQESPVVKPATEALLEPVGDIQTSKFVGNSGTESSVLLGLRLTGNGTLSNARISLRFVDDKNNVFLTYPVIRARLLKTPWWSDGIQLDLGRNLDHARIEMVLESKEISKVFAADTSW